MIPIFYKKTTLFMWFLATILAFYCDEIVRLNTLHLDYYANLFFQAVTFLGNALYSIPLLIIFVCYRYPVWQKKSKRLFYNSLLQATGAIISCALIVNIGKIIFGRARPKLIELYGAHHFDFFTFSGYNFASFPSGHSLTFGVIAFFISFKISKLMLPFFLLILLVATSRVMLGAHYVSDVVASVGISYYVAYFWHKVNITNIKFYRIKNYVHAKP